MKFEIVIVFKIENIKIKINFLTFDFLFSKILD